MRLHRLRVERLRLISQAELVFGTGIHWLLGPNGSGKSSVLEAVSMLASGRSFRGGTVDGCVQRDADALIVFAELSGSNGGLSRVGLQREARGGFEARIDGEPVRQLSELFRTFPAVVLPADTGELISGPGELRRRFVDWGLFHVEPEFFARWRRYARALKQRNLVLRRRDAADIEAAWREELATEGQAIHVLREHYLASLEPWVGELSAWLLPQLGEPVLRHRPGWPAEKEGLKEALARGLETDRRLGFTGLGPHRAGWSLSFDRVPRREMFSRGQAKLASLLMLLAQVAQFTQARGEPPVLGLDDALAELDPRNQERLIEYLREKDVQTLMASADDAAVNRLAGKEALVFHVEQGEVRRRL